MVDKIKNIDWKMITYVAGLIFFAGVYISTLKANCERLNKVEIQSSNNKESIIGIQKDISYIREGIDEIKKEVKSKP